ncbi:hypothetical protein JCM10908_005662 [Rhodotorula pacifica]|uniref:uncharacterized protein n=1 Tax=Rhodotorula pacifica TaxID=1495444 RepID=UPI003180D77A
MADVAADPAQTPTHPPYGNLSGELLLQIFEIYLATADGGEDGRRPRRTEDLIISKRLYRIIHPIWISDLKIVRKPANVRTLLAQIVNDRQTRYAIRRLHISVFPDFSDLHAAALSLVTNLTALRLTHQHGDSYRNLSPHHAFRLSPDLEQAIAALPVLRELSFDRAVQVRPSFSTKSLKLKSAAIPFTSLNPDMALQLARSGTTSVTLYCDAALDVLQRNDRLGQLPWATLRNLTFTAACPEHSRQPNLLGALEGVLLIIGNSSSRNATDLNDLDIATSYPQLFALVYALTATKITYLDIEATSLCGRLRWKREAANAPFVRQM